ncbi:MAG: rod shape-determining protein MreC [Clostridia bacterium]|nr:rod shape-determining protein MreC [Clostridia bacterium]
MNGFFKSKTFFVLITLVILLGGVPAILSAMGQGNFVKDVCMAVVTPALEGAHAVGRGIRGFYEYFSEFDRLREENKALAERVNELESLIYDAELLEEENEWMRRYLGAKRANTDFVFCDANVIGSDGGFVSSFTLDRGSTSGIKEGMPVVTEVGVVGRVTEVGLTFCRVSTIINYDSSVGAYDDRSGALGLVNGDFDLRRDGLCRLEYLRFDADIEIGDKIYSSGLGSVYPRGLYIGEITDITGDEYNHTKIAVIKPAASLDRLTKVMIMTDYSVSVEEEN